MLKVILIIWIDGSSTDDINTLQFQSMEQCEEAKATLVEKMTEAQDIVVDNLFYDLSWKTDYRGSEMICVQVLE